MDTAGVPSELVNDYTTWINTIRTSIALMKNLSLSAYLEYAIRDSAAQSLEYDRFSTGLSFTYVYEY